MPRGSHLGALPQPSHTRPSLKVAFLPFVSWLRHKERSSQGELQRALRMPQQQLSGSASRFPGFLGLSVPWRLIGARSFITSDRLLNGGWERWHPSEPGNSTGNRLPGRGQSADLLVARSTHQGLL